MIQRGVYASTPKGETDAVKPPPDDFFKLYLNMLFIPEVTQKYSVTFQPGAVPAYKPCNLSLIIDPEYVMKSIALLRM